MPNFPRILQAFLIDQMQNGGWTLQDPPWDDVKWAWLPSRGFLLDGARRNSNWLWVKERRRDDQAETERLLTSWSYVDVFIFSCAADNGEDHVEAARDRMLNMRDMITTLVNSNKTKFKDAWVGRTAGGAPLPDSNTDPVFFVYVLAVKFWHEPD